MFWNHEKHEKHERDGILAVKSDDKISVFLCVSWLNKKSVMCVLEPRKARKTRKGMGILAIKFDDKISGYIVNYTYIQLITIFFNLRLGLRLWHRNLCDVFNILFV